jgi:fucose permease
MPIIWFFSILLGLLVAVEFAPGNWGPLFFKDVYGLSPEVEGAAFVSLFYLLFTSSRLLGGFFIEKIGYYRSLYLDIIITILILFIGFSFSLNGIWILAASGLFISQFWILGMSLAEKRFGTNAGLFCSVIITLMGLFNVILQLFVGYINEMSGGHLGYPISLLFAIIALGMVLVGKTKYLLKTP